MPKQSKASILLQQKQQAASQDTSSQQLRELAATGNKAICEKVAANPNTPTDILLKLGTKYPKQLLENPVFPLLLYRDCNVRVRVAIHPNTPKRALSVLAEDESEWTRCNVAKHPNTTGNLLSALATEKNHAVRSYVAQNSNTSVSLLKILAKDEHLLVRQAVASNPNTPLYLLKELASDENFNVELGLAKNPNTPQNMINEEVQYEAPKLILQKLRALEQEIKLDLDTLENLLS